MQASPGGAWPAAWHAGSAFIQTWVEHAYAVPHAQMLQVTDQGLQHIAHQKTLLSLDLTGVAAITDAGMRHLSGALLLKLLLLMHACLLACWLGHWLRLMQMPCAGLTNLHSLNLQGLESITEAGLGSISGLHQLTRLNLELCENVCGIRPLAGEARSGYNRLRPCCQ